MSLPLLWEPAPELPVQQQLLWELWVQQQSAREPVQQLPVLEQPAPESPVQQQLLQELRVQEQCAQELAAAWGPAVPFRPASFPPEREQTTRLPRTAPDRA